MARRLAIGNRRSTVKQAAVFKVEDEKGPEPLKGPKNGTP